MSVNTGPAKVRVLSSGVPDATPARRRGDVPSAGAKEGEALTPAAQSAIESGTPQGAEASASLLWIAGAVVLFVIGCAAGGVLITLSMLYPGVFG